ncbi:DUF6194 family protein [Schlesneria sp. T3-172]|uniref:DUF6194 family protein n=1 Tax=Schlesneria TaxID=656899 RepID=UPI002F2149B7
MDPQAIRQFIELKCPGTRVLVASRESGAPEAAWGDSFFIYDPDGNLPSQRQFPYATIVVKDYPGFDEFSQLNRPGIFRLNLGLGKDDFRSALGLSTDKFREPTTPAATEDFAAVNRLMPHPVYAAQGWVCILNPSRETFRETIEPLIAAAYLKSLKAFRQT